MKPQTAALVISLLAPALAAPVSPTNNGQIENNYSFINPVGSASPPSLGGSQAAAKPSSTSGDNSSGALPVVDGDQVPSVKDTVHGLVGDESKSGQHSVNDSPSKRDPQGFGMGGGSSPFGSMSGMPSGGSGGSSSGMPMPGMGSGGSGGPSGGSPFGSMSGMGSGGSGGKPSGSMPMPGMGSGGSTSGSKPKSGGKGPAPSDVASSAMGKAFGMGGSGSGASPSATSSPTSSQPTATPTSSSNGGVLDNLDLDNLDLLEASSL
jgi:hypothetical protein